MRSASWWRQFAVVVVGILGPLGCNGGGSSDCQNGAEGCPCTPEGLCLSGLQCLSNLCVNPGDPSGEPQTSVEPTTDEPTDSGNDPTGQSPGCGAGLTRCADECVDVQGHPQHCGMCDNGCPGDGVCVVGECAAAVDCSKEPCPGFTYCDEATKKCLPGCAFNPQCGPGAKCDMASHECVCNPGFHECGGVCVLDGDATACGASCEVCPAVNGGQPACIEGKCGAVCNEDYEECGGKCYNVFEEVICESNRDTCTPCPNAMGEPDPTCTLEDECTYYCYATGHIPCGDKECKIEEGYFCDVDSDCCQLNGPLVCKNVDNYLPRCVKP